MYINLCDVDSPLPFRCLAPGGIDSSLSPLLVLIRFPYIDVTITMVLPMQHKKKFLKTPMTVLCPYLYIQTFPKSVTCGKLRDTPKREYQDTVKFSSLVA
jgi:hypothetical protein